MPGIVPHRHCIVCGKAIEPEKTFCSDECKMEWEKEKKRQKYFTIFMFFMFLGLLFLLMLTAH